MGSVLKALMVHGACCDFHVVLTGWMRGGTRETQTSLYLETDGDYLFSLISPLRCGNWKVCSQRFL